MHAGIIEIWSSGSNTVLTSPKGLCMITVFLDDFSNPVTKLEQREQFLQGSTIKFSAETARELGWLVPGNWHLWAKKEMRC